MSLPVKLDHCVVHVSAGSARTNSIATLSAPRWRGAGRVFRPPVRRHPLNLHGPGMKGNPVARLPGHICFEWKGPIGDAVAHLARHRVPIERGPVRATAPRGR